MIGYAQYSKIKDNYCICYFGHADEYLIQLKLLKDVIKRNFQGLNIHFGCRDEKVHLLSDCDNVLKVTQIKARKAEFAHIKEIKSDGTSHPIEDLLLGSGVTNMFVSNQQKTETVKCVIVTKGILPTGNLGDNQIKSLEKMAKEQGYYVSIDDKSIEGAGWIIGVESPQLFEAAGKGIRTTLVPTGVGTRLYKNMFPNAEVFA